MNRVVVDDEGCWIFTGYCNPVSGYGQVANSRRPEMGPRTITAHVAVWTYFEGPVPDGLELDHLCRKPPCCNPGHLEPVPHKVNCLRGDAPRILLHVSQRCLNGHDLAVTAPLGGHCRTCRDTNRADYYARTGR